MDEWKGEVSTPISESDVKVWDTIPKVVTYAIEGEAVIVEKQRG